MGLNSFKNIFALLSLLAPKKVTKKRHPLPGPVKQALLVSEFFAVGATNSSRVVGTQTCVAYRSPKNPEPSARSKWGPGFPRSLMVTTKGTSFRRGLMFLFQAVQKCSNARRAKIVRNEPYLPYDAMTNNERNAASGRFSTAC